MKSWFLFAYSGYDICRERSIVDVNISLKIKIIDVNKSMNVNDIWTYYG